MKRYHFILNRLAKWKNLTTQSRAILYLRGLIPQREPRPGVQGAIRTAGTFGNDYVQQERR